MANETTSTTLNDLMPQIVAEALFVASEKSIMRQLVRNYSIPAGSGKSIVVPRYPRVTAATLNEAVAPSNTAVSTDGVTLTVSEVGLTTVVSDIALIGASSNVVADVGRLFGEAIARKMDSDIMGLFNTFTTNTVGSESTTATVALLAQAAAKLRAQGYDTAADCAYILHPFVAYDVKANLTNTFANPNGGFVQNEAMAAGYIGTLFGIPVYESSLVGLEQVVGGNDGDYANALIHRDALGLAMMKDITIESQREAQLRGFSLTGSAVYAVGELYDNAGVRMVFDSTIA